MSNHLHCISFLYHKRVWHLRYCISNSYTASDHNFELLSIYSVNISPIIRPLLVTFYINLLNGKLYVITYLYSVVLIIFMSYPVLINYFNYVISSQAVINIYKIHISSLIWLRWNYYRTFTLLNIKSTCIWYC